MQKFTFIFLFTTCLLMTAGLQQVFAQDPDTLDVAQGYETLNLAIEGDTTATGEPKNLNRVYRLERGGYYLLNGSVENLQGTTLRIVAAKEGVEHPPLLISAADLNGDASRPFLADGNVEVTGLYITGISNLGIQATNNMFRLNEDEIQLIIKNCFLDHDAQSFVRMNADNQKLYVYDSQMRNTTLLSEPSNGRFIDTRGNTQDTILVQNSTLYMATADVIRDGDGIIKNLIFDHVTVHQEGDKLEMDRVLNARVTNNLFIDCRMEGDVFVPGDPADSLWNEFIAIDSLNAPGIGTEADRHIVIRNNNHVYTPEIQAWMDSEDSVRTSVFHNIATERFINANPNIISEGLISEFPDFTNAPDPDVALDYIKHRYYVADDLTNPDPRSDGNGIGELATASETFGIEEVPFDFSYPTEKVSYTAGEGNFPLGDLNWFPDKKAEWEIWVATGIQNQPGAAVPQVFALDQNYPNPFNPTTSINYRLNKTSKVQLIVYNALGQKVIILVDNATQKAGAYQVQWDGQDQEGRSVASGLYLYQLTADKQTIAKKMLLLK